MEGSQGGGQDPEGDDLAEVLERLQQALEGRLAQNPLRFQAVASPHDANAPLRRVIAIGEEKAKNTEGIGENPKLKTTGLASSEASRFWLPSTFR
jgi:hypothetical protein